MPAEYQTVVHRWGVANTLVFDAGKETLFRAASFLGIIVSFLASSSTPLMHEASLSCVSDCEQKNDKTCKKEDWSLLRSRLQTVSYSRSR
eukprot:9399836-Pyramimonas_sp.AAC.1